MLNYTEKVLSYIYVAKDKRVDLFFFFFSFFFLFFFCTLRIKSSLTFISRFSVNVYAVNSNCKLRLSSSSSFFFNEQIKIILFFFFF
jgi:hypothetical protein